MWLVTPASEAEEQKAPMGLGSLEGNNKDCTHKIARAEIRNDSDSQ